MKNYRVVVEVPLNPDGNEGQNEDPLYTFATELLENNVFVEVVQKVRPSEKKVRPFDELAQHALVVARKSLQEAQVEAVIAVTFINFAPFNRLEDCENTIVLFAVVDKHGPVAMGRAHAKLPEEHEAALKERFRNMEGALVPKRSKAFDPMGVALLVQLVEGYKIFQTLAEEAIQKNRRAKAN